MVEIYGNVTNDIAVTIYENIFYGNGTNNNQGGGIEESTKGAGTLSITLENNTLYHNTSTLGEIRLQNNITSFTAKNNIIYAATVVTRISTELLKVQPL